MGEPGTDVGQNEHSLHDNACFGRMTDPTGASVLRGICGDEMEFYIYIQDGVIHDVRYYTEGCADTRACGLAVAKRAKGKSVMDVLGINAKEIIESTEYLSEQGRHCAILAVSALYRAVADYLLKP